MAEDFSDLVDNDFSDLVYDIDLDVQGLFDSSGLGFLNDAMGGGLAQATSRNYSDPFFDPSTLQRQDNYWRQAMERAQTRADVEREIDFEMPELDLVSSALLGIEQGAADRVREIAGLADALRIPGARSVGQAAGRHASEIDELTDTGGMDSGAIQFLTRGVTSVIPGLAANIFGGFLPLIAAAGAQSFGSTFEDAQDGYIRQGFDPETARNSAYLPALISGLITAGVTRLGGRSGVELDFRKLTPQAVSGMIRNPLVEILKGAGKEGIEEASDQIGQAIVQKLSFNPDLTLSQAVFDVVAAGGLGAVLGGLIETSAAGIRAVADKRTEPDVSGQPSPEVAPEGPVAPEAPIEEPPPSAQAEAFSDLVDETAESAPTPEPAPIPEPVVAEETVGLRRGRQTRARGPEALGARVLTALGADEDTAREFMAQYMKLNPDVGDLENFRNQIIQAFNESGFEPENAGGHVRENPKTYEDMGYTPEDAREIAARGKAENDRKRAEMRERNKGRMAGIRRGVRADVTPQKRAEPQQPIAAPPTPKVEPVAQSADTGAETLAALRAAERVPEIPSAQEQEPDQKIAPVVYRGPMGPMHLYDLTADIPGHPAGSTVSGGTLREAGFVIPAGMPGSIEGGETNERSEEEKRQEEGVLTPSAEAGAVEPAPAPEPERPRRTRVEERELNRILDKVGKKRLSSDEVRRREVLEAKLPFVSKADGGDWGDIIDYIKGKIGRIQGKKLMKPGQEGFYSEAYKEAITMNALKPLFSNKGDGQNPDDVVDDLRRDRYLPEGARVEDLWELLIAAAKKRKATRRSETREQKLLAEMDRQHVDFYNLAIQNERPNKKKARAAKPVSVDSLVIGSEFEIDGEKFEVSHLEFKEDGTLDWVEVSDGKRFGAQRVNADQVIHPDGGKVKPEPTEGTTNIAPGQIEHDAAEPSESEIIPPADDEPFSLGGPQEGQPSRVLQSTGTPGIRQMVESSDLPANTKLVILALLDTPLMQELDWNELRFELWDFIQTGVAGARVGRLIRVAESASADTFVHEITHIMFDFLPASYKAAMEADRLSELNKRFGDNIPENLKSGTMTSKQFQESGYDLDFYPLSNASEFVAHYVGRKFADEAFKNRNQKPHIWNKLREWFQAMVDALKRALGLSPDKERVYREMLRGVHKPNLNAIVEAEEQNTFSANARQARNAAELTRTKQEKEIEATHQLAQSVDIVEFLTKHGAAAATFAAQRALSFADYLGIRAVGVDLNNGKPETYRQLKARLADQYQRNWMARLASVQIANLEARLNEAVDASKDALKRITSPTFLKKLARRAALESKANNSKLLDEAAASILESAYKQAIKVLREEAKSDLDVAEAEGMIREIENAMKSSSAMSMLINDMVTVLSSTPEGVVALSNPNVTRAEILRIYTDLKRSTGQPLFNENLMRWAAYILARNAELRDALWAAQLARNSTIRAQMGPYEKKFLADLEADPLKTLKRELRAAKKRTSDFERARFAFLTLNKEVTRELEELQSQMEAGQIAGDILSDPDFKGFRKEVFTDAKVEGTQRPFVAFADKLLVLPSGREVNVDPEFMKGSKTFFSQMRAQYLAAVSELEQWLQDPANAYDPNYSIHRRNLTELQDYFTSLDVLRPADTMRMMNLALTIIRDAVDVAGGRMKAAALKAVNHWNRIKTEAGWWNQRWSERIHAARIMAMKSHEMKWSSFFGSFDEVRANREWWHKVGNILIYSHNRQQGGFKVGDQLPSGWKVTKADMDALSVMAEATSAGFDVMKDDQITEDFLGEVGLFRRALKGSENMTRRVFNDEMLDFARIYSEARSRFQEAFRNEDEAGMRQAEQQMIDLLNQNWDKIGFAFVWDRNAEFAEVTAFDGENNAFDVIARQMLANPNAVTSFDQLLDKIVSLTSEVTRDEARKIVMVEWGRLINKWHQQAKDAEGKMVLPVRGQRAKNAATRSRNNAMAPYVFYEYGFKDNRSTATFAAGLHSRALDRLVAGLIAIEDDLDRQIKELQASPNPKALQKQRARERKNGDTYDNLTSLESRKKKVSTVLHTIVTYDEDQDVDITIGRTLGAQTGLLVSQIRATARNFTTGPLYIGMVINRLLGSSVAAYPTAAFYSWAYGVKGFGSVGMSAGKWLGKKLTYSIADIPRAIMQIGKRDFRGAFDTMTYGLADALGQEAIERVKQFKRLQDAGMIFIPDFELERQNVVMGSLAYMGKLSARELPLREKIGQLPAMAMEVPLMFLRAFMPFIGDTAINAAAVATMESRFGPFAKLEDRLKDLFLDWQRNNYRQFDFNNLQSELNIFSHQEIFPKALDAEKAFLELRRFFQEAGLSFDQIATRFLGELQRNPKARMLTDDEMKTLSMLAIDQVNRSSPAGSPRALMKNTGIMNWIKPFMSWKARTLEMFLRATAVPAQSARSRKAQWIALAALILLPMLLFNALLIQPVAEEGDRFLAKVLHNQEKSSRQPWEREGFKSQMIGWSINATLGVPFLDIAMNTALNDLPVRASLNPDLAMIEKGQDVLRFIGGAIQTGDPTFKLPETVVSLFPEAKIVLNRLESTEGRRESSNVIALMRRHGQTELLRVTGEPPAGVNYNELSPYGPALENAAMRGDLREFRQIFNEAVQVARKAGRDEPERVVRQLFSHRNPYDRAFKQKLTEGQRRDFLAKLSEGERAQVLDMEQKFRRAADIAGVAFNTFKDESRGTISGPTRSTSSSGGLRRGVSGGLRRGQGGGLRRTR